MDTTLVLRWCDLLSHDQPVDRQFANRKLIDFSAANGQTPDGESANRECADRGRAYSQAYQGKPDT
jgi:hypothetical protein